MIPKSGTRFSDKIMLNQKSAAMAATCREACCSVTPRLSVAELFERGFRRTREAPRAIAGAPCTGADDNTVSFSLDVVDGRIAAIGFCATCCATLIAYCEYIAEIAPGFRFAIARELTAANLVDSVPGVPALKRDRAVLAIAAFRAALLAADNDLQLGASIDEGRLHFRHAAP